MLRNPLPPNSVLTRKVRGSSETFVFYNKIIVLDLQTLQNYV